MHSFVAQFTDLEKLASKSFRKILLLINLVFDPIQLEGDFLKQTNKNMVN